MTEQHLQSQPPFNASSIESVLAKPEPEGPTDEELLETMSRAMRDDLAQVSRLSAQQAGVSAGVYRTTLNVRALEYARAVLARWGRPTPQPADGEVTELVADLRGTAAGLESQAYPQTAAQAVLDAVREIAPAPAAEIGAAALRAAADQLGEDLEFYNERVVSVSDLLTIANELDGTNNTSENE